MIRRGMIRYDRENMKRKGQNWPVSLSHAGGESHKHHSKNHFFLFIKCTLYKHY